MIRHNATLRSRIERLEEQRLRTSFGPRVVSLIAGRADDEITAFESSVGVTVLRLGPEEPLGELQARAFSVTGAQFIFAHYSPPTAATGCDGERFGQSPTLEPEPCAGEPPRSF